MTAGVRPGRRHEGVSPDRRLWIQDAEVVVDTDALNERVQVEGALVKDSHPVDRMTAEMRQTEELPATLQGVLRNPVQVQTREVLWGRGRRR